MPPTYPPDQILTPKMAGEVLSIPERTVKLLCFRGEIPGARKVGRRWRIPAWGILAMFKKPEAEPEETQPDAPEPEPTPEPQRPRGRGSSDPERRRILARLR